MVNKLRKIRRQLSILLALCMVFTLTIVNGPIFAAEDKGVTVTYVPGILWGGFGRYVEYEMDGVKYRTDEAPSAINREAWNRMSDEDRRTTYNALYTTTARKAAFGENGYAYIKHWIHQSSEWYEANKIWKERVAKRTFPDLQPIFNAEASLSGLYSDYNDLKNYGIPTNIPTNNSDRKTFQEAKNALEQYFAIGKEYYQKAVDMRAKNIGTAVSFTVVQCTQMLTDMLFVPSVVNGASLASSGMIADVTNVLLQVVGADGGSLVEKLGVVLDNGGTAHLTVAEQVHLYASYMKTYAKLAEYCKADMDTKMGELRTARSNLESFSQKLESEATEKAEKKETEQASYEASIEETFVTPSEKEAGDGDDVYITFAFNWKTEAELKRDLFNNNFDQWMNDNSNEDSFAYPKAAELIFDEVMNQKNTLDNEVTEKVNIISEMFMESYNSANGKIAVKENELVTLQSNVDSVLPEYEDSLVRVPVGGSYFYGTDSYKPELEKYYYGQPYDSFYEQLATHISDYQTIVEAMLENVEILKSSSEELYNSIEKDVQNVIFYFNLLESLEGSYLKLYSSVIWELHNDTGTDPSINYENNEFYINPIDSEAYRNGFSEAFTSAELPEEVYDPNITIDDLAETLAITRPTNIFDEAFSLYLELLDVSEILDRAYDDCVFNEAAFKEGRITYYEEMEAWLLEYKEAEAKMDAALAKIKTIIDSYESLWEGTYFSGAYDNYGYNPYLYNTGLVSISAFDIADLRAYVSSGGNTATLYSKLKTIENKAEIYEVETKELIGEIGVLDIEMQQLRNSTLDDYADSKGTPVKTFYSLRAEKGLDGKWGNLTRNSEDVLYYFNICDIPQIYDILKGETDDIVFLRNAIKEIRSYLDASSVATIPVSNRLYDIYKKATGIKELYESSSYLLTEELRSTVLNLYANPGEGDDILNTINDVKHKHEGVNYTYPPSQYEGVDQDTPVGELTPTAALPGMITMQAPIYHPVAFNTKNLNATLFIYEDSWTEVQSLNLTEDELQGIIDRESDMMKIPFTGLAEGKEYRLDWEITYGTGLTDYEEGAYYFTYTAPVDVFATVELNKDTYDSAEVTVINNTGSRLSNQYVFLDGYDENENLVISKRRPLSNLDTGKTTKIEFALDEAIYTADAYVAGEDGQTPKSPVHLEIGGGDSMIAVPEIGEAANTSAPFIVTVYDQYGGVYEGGTVDWSLFPEVEGVSIGEDGIVTVTSAAGAAVSSTGSITCTVTATLRGTTVFDTKDITIKRGSANADVDWTEVEDKIIYTSYTYGDRDDKAGPLGEGTATAGDAPLQGTFSYKNPAGILSAGEQAITVVFTVTTPGEYQSLRLEHNVAVTVAKRQITGKLTISGRGAVGETLTAVFTSEISPEEYDIVWLPGGSTVSTTATYIVAAADRGKTITVKAVGKGNYTGEIAGETGISIPSAVPKTPGTGGDGSSSTSLPKDREDNNAEKTSETTKTNVVDRVRLETYVETAERGSGIVIPISENNTSTAQLSLNTFETMTEKEMTLTVQRDDAAISIPSASLDSGAIKELFGSEAEHGEISISIIISQPSSDETALLNSAAASEGLRILGTPVVFSVSASYNGETVEVASFNQYVRRSLEVTKDIAENVSTAIVFEEDNTFRPVPTSVHLEDGKYYVIISSRTNSTYVLVSHTLSFSDTDGRWYEDAVKEMAGRQIMRGIGNSTFAGNREITRAEFASIMVRALGLPIKGMSEFSDVPKDAWYSGAVAAAAKYRIVSGQGVNSFNPMALITREEAMQMIFNASKLIPFNGVEEAVNSKAFSDYKEKSQWAAEAVDFNLSNGLIVGSNGKINPKANITRGEVAAVVLRLLQKAKLVNDIT